MGRFRGVRKWFRLATRRTDVHDEVGFEIESHLQRCEEDLQTEGWGASAAREEARRRFGDVGEYRRQLQVISVRRARRERWARAVDLLYHDLKYATRSLARAPVVSLGIVATLALGIGANATMFGVIDRVLLSPPPHVEDADRVARLYSQQLVNGSPQTSAWFTYPDYTDLFAATAFSSVATYARDRVTLGSGANATRVSARWVSASFLPLLGVTMQAGRRFGPDDDRPDATPTAIIGHAFWLRHFGGDPDIVGRVISVGRAMYTIVGVTPAGFTGVDLEPVDIWLPIQTEPAFADSRDHRTWYWTHVIARLGPDVARSAAEVEATTLHRRARSAARNEVYEGALVVAPLQAARGPQAPDESVVARWLGLVSVIVLIVACANVANLLLARAKRREREIGVRLALGAGRSRVVGQLLTESVLLAAVGGGAAVLVAAWGSTFVGTILLPGAGWDGMAITGRMLGFTLAVAVVTGIGAGVIPAFLTAGTDVQSALKDGLRSSDSRSQTRVVLLIAQAALSVVLLVGAGLFVRSLHAIRQVDLGFDPDGVMVVTLEGQPGGDRQVLEVAYDRVRERLREYPGVGSAAATQATPFRNTISVGLPRIPGRDSLPRPPGGGPYIYAVTPDFFQAMGIRIVRGRPFLASDGAGAPPAVVVNETLARLFWPGEDAVGRCMIIGDDEDSPCVTVVGVAEDSRRQRVIEGGEGLYYVPRDQEIIPRRTTALLVKTTLPEDQFIPVLQRDIYAMDAGIRFARVEPLRSYVDPQFRSWELGATMFSLFGALALIVAAVGLYSVLAFEVTRRTRELGIRAALGATAGTLMAFVFRDGFRLAATGLVVGVGLSLVAAGPIEGLLFGVSARDPWVFGAVTVALLCVAVVASVVPAFWATRVVPGDALRAE